MKIGLAADHKTPPDICVALSPVQCASAMQRYPGLQIVAQHSNDRTFTDEDYRKAGVEIQSELNDCDVILGIKEIPPAYLLPDKTYFFFSHTIKKQPHNRAMLQDIIRKNITLIDYEVLRWENNKRILGFGRFAGIVGTYNAFLTWGRKYNRFTLQPAWQCSDYSEVIRETAKIKLPPLKIVLTGGGRVANGALEMLRALEIRELTPAAFLFEEFDKPVFVHLDSHQLYHRKDGQAWDTQHFYQNHHEYGSSFRPYFSVTDILINGIFWTADLPRLFEKGDTALPEFKISVIADISCDIDGSVPITVDATPIKDPVFGWDRREQKVCPPFTPHSIDVMAVSNLPNELPKDASQEFGEQFMGFILPELFESQSAILYRATIARNGHLTEQFAYLGDYISADS